MVKANEIMTKRVLSASANTSFNDVVKVFTGSEINHLPITNSDGGLRAIISATDVLGAIHEMDQFAFNYNGYSLEKKLDVREEMSADVITIRWDTPVQEAVALMVNHNIHALPVLDEKDEMVGIVTSNDILKAIHNKTIKIN